MSEERVQEIVRFAALSEFGQRDLDNGFEESIRAAIARAPDISADRQYGIALIMAGGLSEASKEKRIVRELRMAEEEKEDASRTDF